MSNRLICVQFMKLVAELSLYVVRMRNNSITHVFVVNKNDCIKNKFKYLALNIFVMYNTKLKRLYEGMCHFR